MAISTNYFTKMNYYNNSSSLLNGLNNSYSSNKATGYSSVLNQLSRIGSAYYGVNKAESSLGGAQEFITSLKSASEELNQTMNALRGFDAKGNTPKDTAVSSDVSSLSVKTLAANAKIEDISVKIDQAASGQVNKGESLDSGKKIYSEQNYKFEIESQGIAHEISFSVSAGDSQADMQKKMAQAINDKNIGVKAAVSAEGEKSVLTIESKNTGDSDKNRFTVKDITGDALKKTGTSAVTQSAADAKYSINGGAQLTSASNTIELAKGVTGIIKKASDKEITVGMGRESKVSAENVKEMVKQFNAILGNAVENKADTGLNRMFRQLKGISTAYEATLGNVGVNVDSEGLLSVNEAKLNSALEDGRLEKFFTENKGSSYGFSNRLAKISSDISKNPTSYVSQAALSDLNPTSYFSGTNPTLNYLQAGRYNQISNMGVLFDTYL